MSPYPPFPRSLTDARGSRITLDQPPQRIVSLVPSQTELLATLQLDREVVGLTRFCIHPADWKQRKQIVGGTKQLNPERLAALHPDLILANLEENTPEMVEAAEALAPVHVSHVQTLADALDMIRDIGLLTDRMAQAETLTHQITIDFDALPAFTPLRAAYLIWQDPFMTIGYDTFIHDMMHRAGLVNVFGNTSRYPTLTLDTLRATRPDVVLLSSEPFPFKPKHAKALQGQLPQTPLLLVDGECFSWYGSRLLHTPGYLAHLRQQIERLLS